MYEFLDRLFNVALPRVRDFRGINPNAFDGRGNYNMGLKEQLIFPEIEFDKIDKVRGMDISCRISQSSRSMLKTTLSPSRAQFPVLRAALCSSATASKHKGGGIEYGQHRSSKCS